MEGSSGKPLRGIRRVAYVAVVIGIANLIVLSTLAVQLNQLNREQAGTTTKTTTYANLTASGSDLIPSTSFADAPIVNTTGPAGDRLTDLNRPLNATQLAVFNDAPLAYFETAGEMFLNNTLTNLVGSSVVKGPVEVFNGKPSVIYLGANTCIYCGENRWAMALALGSFGNFSELYMGYSSLQDGDLPTVYWAPSHYNITQGVVFGNFYNSSYISFISIEYQSPITQPVQLPSLTYLQQQVAPTYSPAYTYAVDLIGTLNYYTGTPYTVWGNYIVPSADADDFGNTSTTSSFFPLANLTHDQVIADLAHPKDQFSWTEYAAADLYIAMTCSTIGNTAPICSLNAIQQIEHKLPTQSVPTTAVTAGEASTSTMSSSP